MSRGKPSQAESQAVKEAEQLAAEATAMHSAVQQATLKIKADAASLTQASYFA